MAQGETLHSLSINARMNRIRARMYMERTFGVAVAEKERFLALCQEHEGTESGVGILSGHHVRGADREEACWVDFDNWHDAPALLASNERIR